MYTSLADNFLFLIFEETVGFSIIESLDSEAVVCCRFQVAHTDAGAINFHLSHWSARADVLMNCDFISESNVNETSMLVSLIALDSISLGGELMLVVTV